MNKRPKLPKAANGVQQVRASQNGQRQVVSSLVGAGAEAALPGVGGAAVGAMEGLSSLTKGEDGLYKSRVAQALDGYNPITQIGRDVDAAGKVFQGDFKGAFGSLLGDQTELKDAIAKQKLEAQKQLNWSRVGPDASAQLSQFKKGGRKVASKAIEIEGGEPHFSKKSNGKRTLKQYHPHGPKHSQGGIATLAEEGDAIVTAKGGKGAQAVAAHQRGDHQTVEKLINQMPEDKGSKKASHGKKSVARYGSKPRQPRLTPEQLAVKKQQNLLNNNGYEVVEDGKVGDHTRAAANDFMGLNEPLMPKNTLQSQVTANGALPAKLATLPTASGGRPANTNKGRAQNAALSSVQALPSIYNLGQGLFGDVAKTTRRGYSPELQQYQDLSAPQRSASQQAMSQQVSNARNLSGGNVGNVRANANQAFADNATRQGAIDAQESGRRLAVNNQNVELRNQAQAMNNAMGDNADSLDLQNQAKKSEALAKGLEGFGAIAGNQQLMGNQQAADEQNFGYLKDLYKNYTIGPDGKVVLKQLKKGAKAITVKK